MQSGSPQTFLPRCKKLPENKQEMNLVSNHFTRGPKVHWSWKAPPPGAGGVHLFPTPCEVSRGGNIFTRKLLIATNQDFFFFIFFSVCQHRDAEYHAIIHSLSPNCTPINLFIHPTHIYWAITSQHSGVGNPVSFLSVWKLKVREVSRFRQKDSVPALCPAPGMRDQQRGKSLPSQTLYSFHFLICVYYIITHFPLL